MTSLERYRAENAAREQARKRAITKAYDEISGLAGALHMAAGPNAALIADTMIACAAALIVDIREPLHRIYERLDSVAYELRKARENE